MASKIRQFTSMKTWVFIFVVVRNFTEGAEEYFILPTAWYYIKSLGGSKSFLAAVFCSYNISAIFCGPVLGKLTDRFGHVKFFIVACFFAKLVGYLLYSIPVSVYFPLVGRFIAGIGDGASAIIYGQLALYTEERYRAKVFVLMDGVFVLGGVFGPAISSFLTFNVNVLGWKIDAGNSPGVILVIIYLLLLVISLWLPSELGYNVDGSISLNAHEDEQGFATKISNNTSSSLGSTIFCLFYLIFLGLFYSSSTAFLTPLLAQEHFHTQFIHVKMLFLVSSLYTLSLLLVLYIAAEYFKERKLLAVLMIMRTVPIAVLTYFAFSWRNVSWYDEYLLIFFTSMGMPYFSFSFGSSLLSKLTDLKDAAFYQGLSFTCLHVAYVAGRVISGFTFTPPSFLFFSSGLIVSWIVGVLWFALEYEKLVPNLV